MAEKRKDPKGRLLRSGEYYDKTNGRYMFRKMIDGERYTITAENLVELRKQENELLCNIDKGLRINQKKAKMTLNDYFDFWWETYAKSGRKATTCTNYKSYYNTYVKDTIGKKKITKITKVDCQLIINKMAADGLKHSTMANLKSCLNNIFDCAVDDDIILKNPARNIELPKTEAKKREAVEFSDVIRFMEYVKNSPRFCYAYPAYMVLFNTGARIGEVAALTRQDLRFKENKIVIDKTVNRYRKKDYGFTMGVASTKSDCSDREAPMNSELKAELLKHCMKSSAVTATLPYVDDFGVQRGIVKDFVFVNSYGRAWSEPSFLELTKNIIETYNREAQEKELPLIKTFCPHMARHTYTSLAYEAGADIKAVSRILGHASTRVTLDTYTHLSETKEKEMQEVAQTIKIS